MHPILTRTSRLALYLALWGLIGASLGALLAETSALDLAEALALAVPLAIVYGFVCLATWYLCRALPLSMGAIGSLVAAHVAAAAASSALWVALAVGGSRALDLVMPGVSARFAGGAMLVFTVGVLLALLATAGHYLVIALERSREAETRGLSLKVLAREAELKALRAQIDPHFLFNSLNSISALTAVDPAGARRMCVLLGDFLRSSLKVGAMDRIPLADEVSLAERFLAIEQVRFGKRLTADVAIEPDAATCLVPPLLLQPLIENAVRHGLAGLIEGGTITVRAGRHDGRLIVAVENPCDPDRPVLRGDGLGLANVRSRLATEFGSDARFDAQERGGSFRVELSIPAIEPAPAASRS